MKPKIERIGPQLVRFTKAGPELTRRGRKVLAELRAQMGDAYDRLRPAKLRLVPKPPKASRRAP